MKQLEYVTIALASMKNKSRTANHQPLVESYCHL